MVQTPLHTKPAKASSTSLNQAYGFAIDTQPLFQLQSSAPRTPSKTKHINFNLHKGNFSTRSDTSLKKCDA